MTICHGRIALRTKELIADGALDGMRPYKTALRHAEENLTSAQTGLEQAQQQQTAAGENLQTVAQEHLKNPTEASMRGAVQQAAKDMEDAVIVTRQREEAVQKQEAAVQEAKAEHDAVLERTMKEVREQAVADVAAADQQEAERVAAEEEAAEVLRQNENTVAMAVEDFIASEYPDASPELQDEIRQAYREAAEAGSAQQSEDTQPADPNRISQEAASFASRIAKAFQVNVEFTTETQLNGTAFRGAYQNGRIILNRSATQGDMLRRTVIHELVHHSEGSGETYTEAADAILEAAYNGNKEQLQTDLEGVKATYRAQFGDSFTEADARAELVAQRAEEIFTEESINRLTAEKPTIAARIWESLKTFVKKIRGVKDTEADRIRRAEQLFRKALERVNGVQTGSEPRFNLTSADSSIQIQTHHTQEQRNVITEYHNAVDPVVLEAAEQYKADRSAKNKRIVVADVSAREAADLKQLLGIDVEGYRHTVDRSFFNHVAKRHGENGEADTSMRNLNDVARVGWIIENYDTVELVRKPNGEPELADGYLDKEQTRMRIVRYTKTLDGAVYVVEAVGENGYERLWLISAYMKRPANTSQVATVTQTPYAENQPLGNVRNANASPVNSSISTPAENVNTKFSLLPSRNVLNAQIAAHMARMNDVSDGAVPPDGSNTQQQSSNPDNLGERQFASSAGITDMRPAVQRHCNSRQPSRKERLFAPFSPPVQ